MKINTCYSILALFLIFNISLIITKYKNNQNFRLVNDELSAKIQSERDSYKELKNRLILSLRYEDGSINPSLYDDIKQNNLVLRYPNLACSTCMDSLLFYLSDFFTEKELFNIILLIDNTHKQYLVQLKRFHKFNFPRIVETAENMKIFPLDKLNLPYFFFLNEQKKCSMIFIPEKDKPMETKEYIQLIKEKYFSHFGN